MEPAIDLTSETVDPASFGKYLDLKTWKEVIAAIKDKAPVISAPELEELLFPHDFQPTAAEIPSLLSALSHAPSLRKTVFKQLDEVLIRTVATALSKSRQNLEALRVHVDEPSAQLLEKVLDLAVQCDVRELNLAECNLNARCVGLVLKRVPLLPNLVELNLSNSCFDGETGPLFAKAMSSCPNLERLSLQDCGIDDKICNAISPCLPGNLKYLNISWNIFGNAALGLGDSILRTRLQEFELKCRNIPPKELRHLILSLSRCPTVSRANVFLQRGALSTEELIVLISTDPESSRSVASVDVFVDVGSLRRELLFERKPYVPAPAGKAAPAPSVAPSSPSASPEISDIDERIRQLESAIAGPLSDIPSDIREPLAAAAAAAPPVASVHAHALNVINWSEIEISRKTLGTGAKACVLKAKRLGGEVAVKAFPAGQRDKARKEGSIMMACLHGHVLNVWGITDAPSGESYLVMEAMDMGSAAVFWRESMSQNKMVPYSHVMRLARDICSGLQAVHSKNIVHRDCKLDNFLMAHSNPQRVFRAKLADFGAAIHCDDITSNMAPEGSPCVMAPEVAKRFPFDTSADIFGFAVSVNELAGTDFDVSSQLQLFSCRLNSRFSALIAFALRRCLNEDPTKRPTAAQLRDFLKLDHSRSKQNVSFDLRKAMSMTITNIDQRSGSIFARIKTAPSDNFTMPEEVRAAPQLGCPVIWKNRYDMFQERGIVLSDGPDSKNQALVFCIDNGEITERPVEHLFLLPAQLFPSKYPPACVELRLAGIFSNRLPDDWVTRTGLKRGAEITVEVIWADNPLFYASIALKGSTSTVLASLNGLDTVTYDLMSLKNFGATELIKELENIV